MRHTFERLLFSSRWLLTPFYVALLIPLVALLAKTATHAVEMISHFPTQGEDELILAALGLVDLTLTGSLVVLVIFSGYANFVSRVDVEAHDAWPSWLIGIDFSELKLKLMGSIVAIAGIKLLETYMDIEHVADRQLAWQVGIFGAFVIAALLLALADKFAHSADPHD